MAHAYCVLHYYIVLSLVRFMGKPVTIGVFSLQSILKPSMQEVLGQCFLSRAIICTLIQGGISFPDDFQHLVK